MKNQSIIALIILLIALGVLVFFIPNKKLAPIPKYSNPVACTMEAKLCPDGSSVGRQGPNCEFAACPDIKIPDQKPTTPIDNSPKVSVFGATATIKLNQTIKYSDGLSLTLIEVNDSRCPANVMCVWAGEVMIKLSATGGAFGSSNEVVEISGPGRSPTYVSAKGYTFSIADDDGKTFKILVTRDSDGKACYVGGCSSQVCSDRKDVVTTCEYRESYACYNQNSTCERQTDGDCGWTDTAELRACLPKPQ